jgi:diguanylate cyclase (GGDEF)-like protein
MSSDNKSTHKGESASEGAESATSWEDRLQETAKELMAALDPAASSEESVRRMLEDALARALRAEAALEETERRMEWLNSQNMHDEVTGLLNRRGFREALRRGLARSRRYGETGALLLVELGGYEQIVEDSGREAADYMLTAIANILNTRFREVDYVARLNDGRFAVQLLLIGQEDARRRAAMLKGYLDELVVPWQGKDIPVGVRLALAFYGQQDSADDLLERAEAELEERESRIAHLRHPAE